MLVPMVWTSENVAMYSIEFKKEEKNIKTALKGNIGEFVLQHNNCLIDLINRF